MHSLFSYIDSNKFDIKLLPGPIDTDSCVCIHMRLKFNPKDILEMDGNKFFAINDEEFDILSLRFPLTGPRLTVFRPNSGIYLFLKVFNNIGSFIKDLDIAEQIEYKFNPEICHECTNLRLEEEFDNGFGKLTIAPITSEYFFVC